MLKWLFGTGGAAIVGLVLWIFRLQLVSAVRKYQRARSLLAAARRGQLAMQKKEQRDVQRREEHINFDATDPYSGLRKDDPN